MGATRLGSPCPPGLGPAGRGGRPGRGRRGRGRTGLPGGPGRCARRGSRGAAGSCAAGGREAGAGGVDHGGEPVPGGALARWFGAGRGADLAARRDLGRFVWGAAVLGPVAGGLVGASVSWASKGGWWPGLVLQWWAGDGIAVLVIGGPLLLWAQRRALGAPPALGRGVWGFSAPR